MLFTYHQTTLYYRALFDYEGTLHKILPTGYPTRAEIPPATKAEALEARACPGGGYRWGFVSKVETIKRED